jgi:hypothetical protein
MRDIMTFKQFTARFNVIMVSVTKQRDNIEQMIRIALTHYANNGDTSYIQHLINAVNDVRALDGRSMFAYIQAHANVRAVAAKEGNGLTIRKASRRAEVEVTMPSANEAWYDFSQSAQAKPDLKLYSRLVSLEKQAQKAEDDGRLSEDPRNPKLRAELLAVINKYAGEAA